MFVFEKTVSPVNTYTAPGVPCAVCNCTNHIVCDNYLEQRVVSPSSSIQQSNWRAGSGGNEYNKL